MSSSKPVMCHLANGCTLTFLASCCNLSAHSFALHLRQFQLTDADQKNLPRFQLSLTPSASALYFASNFNSSVRTCGSPWLLVDSDTSEKSPFYPLSASWGIGSRTLFFGNAGERSSYVNQYVTTTPSQLTIKLSLPESNSFPAHFGFSIRDDFRLLFFDMPQNPLCLFHFDASPIDHVILPSPMKSGCITYHKLQLDHARQYPYHKHNPFHQLERLQYHDQIHRMDSIPITIKGQLATYFFYPKYVIAVPFQPKLLHQYDIFILFCQHNGRRKPFYLYFSN